MITNTLQEPGPIQTSRSKSKYTSYNNSNNVSPPHEEPSPAWK